MGFLLRNSLVQAVAAVLATAALAWFGTGLHPHWLLAWLAPLPVLLFALGAGRRAAGIVALLGWLGGGCTFIAYFAELGMPLPIWFGIIGGKALGFLIAVQLYRGLFRRRSPIAAIFAFPSLMVALEYLANLATPHGTAASLAYTQLNFLPALQIASLAGPWVITFILLLFPASLAAAFSTRSRVVAACGLAPIAALLIFGLVRSAQPQGGETMQVGLISSDVKDRARTVEGEAAAKLVADYTPIIVALARQGAQIVVLPEKLILARAPDMDAIDQTLQSIADSSQVQIVFGLVRATDAAKYNEARIYAPGQPVRTYDKQHMLPPFEDDLTPGTSLTLLQEPTGPWGVAICKDMDFTPLSRDYGKRGAGVMLVPGWDFVMDAFFHGHIAIMRGVESGFAVVRSAKQGFLTVTDDRGRILGEAASNAAPFAALVVPVPTRHEDTLYLHLGDWFAFLCLGLSAAGVLRLFRRGENAP